MNNLLTKFFKQLGHSLFMIIAGVVAVALGAYIAFLAYQTIFYIPNVNVPSVLNMELDAAQQTLHQIGLKIAITDDHLFREGDRFFVISQNPDAGTEIKKNRTVEVEIRETGISTQIPDLFGKTVGEAEILLSENGYRLGNIAYAMHHQLTQGKIIAQTPMPGENIQAGDEINILVSKGLY